MSDKLVTAAMHFVLILSAYFGMIYSTVSISHLVAKTKPGAVNSLEDLQKNKAMKAFIFKDSIIASLESNLDSAWIFREPDMPFSPFLFRIIFNI